MSYLTVKVKNRKTVRDDESRGTDNKNIARTLENMNCTPRD